MTSDDLAAEWARVIAPDSGDVRGTLVAKAAEFLGIPLSTAWDRLAGAGERFRAEWRASVRDASDAETLTRFYNQSDTELFELIEWHATDAIHYRTLILRDVARRRSGRRYLDYGSGIGNDALVFGEAGFELTLADISDCLLAFAAWRCRRRGCAVQTVDLKRARPPANAFDVAVCFDVLEHIPDPLAVVRSVRESLRDGGLLAIHAPFGADPEHPMHVVHRDVVTPRMRALGMQPIDCEFPPFVRAPQVYEKRHVAAVDRAAYFIYDNYLRNTFGERLAAMYRRTVRGQPPAGRR